MAVLTQQKLELDRALRRLHNPEPSVNEPMPENVPNQPVTCVDFSPWSV